MLIYYIIILYYGLNIPINTQYMNFHFPNLYYQNKQHKGQPYAPQLLFSVCYMPFTKLFIINNSVYST